MPPDAPTCPPIDPSAPLGASKQPAPLAMRPDDRYEVGNFPRYPVDLPQGEGRDALERSCLACHSAAYIMNQPPLTQAQWHQELDKMTQGYGATVAPADLAQIEKYLVAHLGSETRQAAAPLAVPAAGMTVYLQNCVMCHQRTGLGVPGAFPPLAGHAPTLLRTGAAGRAYLVNLILYGITGPLRIGGATYNNVMPPFGTRLDDGQVADVLNYVLTAWDQGVAADAFEPFDASAVAAARGHVLTPQQCYAGRPVRE